jgi:transposase-like protein
MGYPGYVQSPPGIPTLSEQKKKRILAVLADNEGNFNRASAILGISSPSLQKWVREWSAAKTNPNSQSATNPTRNFYEKITNKWSITAFDPSSREVCIEIKTPSSTNHLSYIIPSQRIVD